MANTRTFFRSFAGGEISPEMYGRVDADRYQTGAARVRNMVPKPQGPVASRPGFQYVNEVKDSTKKTRLFPFTYGTDDTYVLEVGSGYIRIYRQGQLLTASGPESPAPATPPTWKPYRTPSSVNTSTNVITLTANHSFATGDPVRFTKEPSVGVLPSPLLQGVTYYVYVVAANQIAVCSTAANAIAGATVANRIQLSGTFTSAFVHYYYQAGELVQYNAGVGVQTYAARLDLPQLHIPTTPDLPSWFQLPSNGTFEVPFYTLTDQQLFDIHFVQSNDVMTFVHPSFPPAELRRYSSRRWSFTGVQFNPSCVAPTGVRAHAEYGQRFSVLGGWYAWEAQYLPNPSRETGQGLVFREGRHGDLELLIGKGEVVWISGTGNSNLDNKRFLVDGLAKAGEDWYVFFAYYDTGKVVRGSWFYDSAFSGTAGSPLTATLADHGYSTGSAVHFVLHGTDNVGEAFPTNVLGGTTYYVINETSNTFQISLSDPLLGAAPAVLAGASLGNRCGVWPRFGYIQQLYQVSALEQTYKVTAVHEDQTESEASDAVSIYNNIYSAGAANIVTWRYFVGMQSSGRVAQIPQRFNIYKLDAGNYGLVGSVDRIAVETSNAVTLTAVSPLRMTWSGVPLKLNDPVSFTQLSGGSALPSGINSEVIYWVKPITSGQYAGQYLLQDRPDGDQIRSTTGGTITVAARREHFFRDDNIAADMGVTIPRRDTEFAAAGNYPRAVTYFEGRRVFAGTDNDRQTLWATKSGTESDISYHVPVVADDRIKFQIAAREATTIRHIVPIGALLLLSNSTEWRASSVDGDAMTPLNISVRPQSFVGANNVQPIVVNNIVVFCSNRGGHVREMGYTNEQQGYMTGDLSLRASHLFDDYEISDLAYAKAPHPVLWFISSSGRLIGLSYVPEERVTAWHWHDTGGTDAFESCAVVAEGLEDRLYVVTRRTIGGVTKRYVERMQLFSVTTLASTVRMDAAKTYSGSGPYQTLGDLQHLAGRTVSILADGKIHPQRQVSAGGVLTLDYTASVVHVGLPYTAELQTLPVTMQIDGFAQGRTKNIGRAWLRLFESHGFQIGPNENNLTDGPAPASGALQSQEVPVMSTPSWQNDGTVLIRQSNPVPLTIVGMTLEVGMGS